MVIAVGTIVASRMLLGVSVEDSLLQSICNGDSSLRNA